MNRLLKKHQQEGMYLLRMASDKQGKVLMVWYEQEQKSKHYKVFGDNVSCVVGNEILTLN